MPSEVSQIFPRHPPGSCWLLLEVFAAVWWQEGFGGLAVPGADSWAGRLAMGSGAFQPEVTASGTALTDSLGLNGLIRAEQSH